MVKKKEPRNGWHQHWRDDYISHYVNGIVHNDDGPTIEYPNGMKEWRVGGELHRMDGPAIEYADGTKEWYREGKRHRLDGPAIECADGYKAWYTNDKLHRIDGPAYELANGYKEWWVDGREVDITAIFGYEPSVPLTEDQQIILRLTI